MIERVLTIAGAIQYGSITGPSIDQFLILVAGGPPGKKNMMVPTWPGSKPISKEIKLPGNWKDILARVPQ